jgi:hypothetical protein
MIAALQDGCAVEKSPMSAIKRPFSFRRTGGGKQLPHSKTAGAVGHTRFGTFSLQQTVPSLFPTGSDV